MPASAAPRNGLGARRQCLCRRAGEAGQLHPAGDRAVPQANRPRTGTRTAGQDTAVNPVDEPSQVQKAREPQDKGAMRSICTNCEPGSAPTKSTGQRRGSGG